MTQVHAVVSGGPDRVLRWREAELDEPQAGEVLVRVEAAGMCHTDLVTLTGLGDRPAVLGHEGCGIVVAVGAGVSAPIVGDRVVMTYAACEVCDRCRTGRRAYCRSSRRLNASGTRSDGSRPVRVDGEPVFSAFFGQSSWSDHAVVRAASCVVVGDVDPAVAAPLGCGFLTGAGAVVELLRPAAGDRVVVVGGGAVGLAAALVAQQDGAEVTVVDIDPARRAVAAGLGLAVGISLGDVPDDPSQALDTTGRPEVVAEALRRLDSCGVLVTVGLGPPRGEIDLADLLHGGKTLRGCIEGDGDPHVLIPAILERQRQGLGLDRLVTTYPMARAATALEDHRAARVVKPVLLP